MESQQPIRVLLVDDAAAIRALLRQIFELEADLEVVGEAADGLDSLRLVADLRPDVVVMDMEMPRMDGVEATKEIKRRWPWVDVIAFTASGGPIAHHEMMQAGAYVKLEKQNARDVPDAVRKAMMVRRAFMAEPPKD